MIIYLLSILCIYCYVPIFVLWSAAGYVLLKFFMLFYCLSFYFSAWLWNGSRLTSTDVKDYTLLYLRETVKNEQNESIRQDNDPEQIKQNKHHVISINKDNFYNYRLMIHR